MVFWNVSFESSYYYVLVHLFQYETIQAAHNSMTHTEKYPKEICNSRVSKQSKNKSYFIYCRTFRSQDIIHSRKGKSRVNYILATKREKKKLKREKTATEKERNENRRIKLGTKRLLLRKICEKESAINSIVWLWKVSKKEMESASVGE